MSLRHHSFLPVKLISKVQNSSSVKWGGWPLYLQKSLPALTVPNCSQAGSPLPWGQSRASRPATTTCHVPCWTDIAPPGQPSPPWPALQPLQPSVSRFVRMQLLYGSFSRKLNTGSFTSPASLLAWHQIGHTHLWFFKAFCCILLCFADTKSQTFFC